MEFIKNREITLRRFFVNFLIHTFFSVAAAVFLWFSLLMLSVGIGFILPANEVEQNVASWLNRLGLHTIVTSEMVPAGADYAFYDLDGTRYETNLSGSLLEDADLFAASGQEMLGADLSGRVYLMRQTDTQRIILTYRVRSVIANPSLRQILPDAEIFMLIPLLLFLLTALALSISRYARRLKKELSVLQDAAEQIRIQNLDFEISGTRLKEFNQVASSLDALKVELDHSLKDQWRMEQQKKKQMSALAHDIKTPLTIVRGNAELLQETPLSEEQSSYTAFILKNTTQIQSYVTRIIEVSKDEFVPSGTSLIRFSDFLAQIQKNAESLGKKKQLSICFHSSDLPEYLPFPEDVITRILSNLLDNAVFYSPSGGTVTLHIYTDRSYHFLKSIAASKKEPAAALIMQISDEGCGFSAEALRLATEEFYQADESRGSREHFGMGLAITKQLVTGLNGELLLANQPDGGAIVTVGLPLHNI